MTLVYAVSLVDRSVIGVLLDSIKRDMQVSDTVMGLVTGFGFAVFYGVASIPVAVWADRGIRRNIIAAGLAVFSLATAMTGFAANIYQVLAGRFILAAGEATQLAPSVSLLADSFPKKTRARAMAIFGAGPSIGIIVGLSAAGLLNAAYGWRITLLVLGIPGIILALLVRFTMSEPGRLNEAGAVARHTKHGLVETLGFLFHQKSFYLLLLAAALNAWPLFGTTIWGPAFMGRVHALGSAQVGLIFGLVYGLLGLAGALTGGLVSDYLGRKSDQRKLLFPMLAAALICPAMLVFLLANTLWLVIVALGMIAFLANAQFGPVWAVMQSISPSRMRATAAACFQLLINIIGLGLGPFLVGYTNDSLATEYGPIAIRYSMLLLPIAALGSCGMLYFAGRHVFKDIERVRTIDR
ncbi:MAG: MFS transporter [Pseudomonadota bacterium]